MSGITKHKKSSVESRGKHTSSGVRENSIPLSYMDSQWERYVSARRSCYFLGKSAAGSVGSRSSETGSIFLWP